MKVGFIGLGVMGSGMAKSLLAAGHEVSVYNRTASKAEALVKEGAVLAASLEEACQAEVLVSMLGDDAAYEAVILQGDKINPALPKGLVHIASGTISTDLSRRLTAAHEAAGQEFLAAPVLGRADMAASGQLFIVAGGPEAVLKKCQPLLDAMGQKTHYLGTETRIANTAKLCMNFMLAAAIETMGEVFAVTQKAGIKNADFLELFTTTVFTAPVYKIYGERIAEDNYEDPYLTLPLGLKDATLVAKAAEELNAPLPLASLIRDQMLRAMAQGEEELDWSVIGRVSARSAGL